LQALGGDDDRLQRCPQVVSEDRDEHVAGAITLVDELVDRIGDHGVDLLGDLHHRDPPRPCAVWQVPLLLEGPPGRRFQDARLRAAIDRCREKAGPR